MTRDRASKLQSSMRQYGVTFVPRPRGGIFSILSGTDAVVSPSYFTLRCGMETVKRAEREPAMVSSELWRMYLSDDSVEKAAYA